MSLLLMLFVLAWASAPQAQTAAQTRENFFTSSLPPADVQNKQAVLDTTHGTIVLDLLPGAAPNHVAHFVTRAREGAYDGTTFHRVIAMGIIQGGDPISKDPTQTAKYGTGGLGVLRFEPNTEKHTRGAVSAVLVPGRRDSAGASVFHFGDRSTCSRRPVHGLWPCRGRFGGGGEDRGPAGERRDRRLNASRSQEFE